LYGNTPLLSALRLKHEWIAKFLVFHGALLNYEQLKDLARNQNSNCPLTNTFNLILKQLDHITTPRTASITPRINVTLSVLHLALINKLNIDFVEFLLKHGADPNEMNHFGARASHYVVYDVSTTNAQRNTNNQTSRNLIRCQVNSWKRLNLLKLLLKYKCEFSKPTSSGVTPLNDAILFLNNFNCVEFLFEHTRIEYLNIIDDFVCMTTLDRLWYRMNNFRTRSSGSVANSSEDYLKSIYNDKLYLDSHIKRYQSLLKKCVLVGAKFYKYLWKTNAFGYNYYLISNFNVLLENLLIYQCPYKNNLNRSQKKYDVKLFIIHGFEFLVESLTSRFACLYKRRFEFSLNRAKWSSERDKFQLQFLIFKSEFQDFQRELTQFERNVDLLLKNGNLEQREHSSIRELNKKIIQVIFAPFLNRIQTYDVGLPLEFEKEFKGVLESFSNLTEATILNESEQQMSNFECRQKMLTYIYMECIKKQNAPLTLKELCRIQVRKSLKILDGNDTNINSINIGQNLKKFIFYE
jgi:hypothetical protein